MPINNNDEKLFSLSAIKKSDAEVNSQIKELADKAWLRMQSNYESVDNAYPELSYTESENTLIMSIYRKR